MPKIRKIREIKKNIKIIEAKKEKSLENTASEAETFESNLLSNTPADINPSLQTRIVQTGHNPDEVLPRERPTEERESSPLYDNNRSLYGSAEAQAKTYEPGHSTFMEDEARRSAPGLDTEGRNNRAGFATTREPGMSGQKDYNSAQAFETQAKEDKKRRG